jgi:hypothetical protein
MTTFLPFLVWVAVAAALACLTIVRSGRVPEPKPILVGRLERGVWVIR